MKIFKILKKLRKLYKGFVKSCMNRIFPLFHFFMLYTAMCNYNFLKTWAPAPLQTPVTLRLLEYTYLYVTNKQKLRPCMQRQYGSDQVIPCNPCAASAQNNQPHTKAQGVKLLTVFIQYIRYRYILNEYMYL